MLGYLSFDVICYSKITVFLELLQFAIVYNTFNVYHADKIIFFIISDKHFAVKNVLYTT